MVVLLDPLHPLTSLLPPLHLVLSLHVPTLPPRPTA